MGRKTKKGAYLWFHGRPGDMTFGISSNWADCQHPQRTGGNCLGFASMQEANNHLKDLKAAGKAQHAPTVRLFANWPDPSTVSESDLRYIRNRARSAAVLGRTLSQETKRQHEASPPEEQPTPPQSGPPPPERDLDDPKANCAVFTDNPLSTLPSTSHDANGQGSATATPPPPVQTPLPRPPTPTNNPGRPNVSTDQAKAAARKPLRNGGKSSENQPASPFPATSTPTRSSAGDSNPNARSPTTPPLVSPATALPHPPWESRQITSAITPTRSQKALKLHPLEPKAITRTTSLSQISLGSSALRPARLSVTASLNA